MELGQSARRVCLVTCLGGLLAGCDGSVFPPTTGQLALGNWGGDNAGVIATDSVTHVHIGCTFGDVVGRIKLDDTGRFQVDGSYVLKAYPVMVGPRLPAQFTGRVVGSSLTLAVAVNDTTTGKVVALGPVTVRYGRNPEMGPCPICRVPRVPARGLTAGYLKWRPTSANISVLLSVKSFPDGK